MSLIKNGMFIIDIIVIIKLKQNTYFICIIHISRWIVYVINSRTFSSRELKQDIQKDMY